CQSTTMSKHNILTESELVAYEINLNLLSLIRIYQDENKLLSNNVKVLDFGCGRGRSVLKLKLQGYDVYGVDVDPEPILNGLDLFQHFGFDGSKLMTTIKTDCLTHFPDNFFDVVFSDQVV